MGHLVYQTMFSFYLLFCLKKNVKKLSRNFEYAKSQKAKKLSVLKLNITVCLFYRISLQFFYEV